MSYAGQLVADEKADAGQASRSTEQDCHIFPGYGQKEVNDLKYFQTFVLT